MSQRNIYLKTVPVEKHPLFQKLRLFDLSFFDPKNPACWTIRREYNVLPFSQIAAQLEGSDVKHIFIDVGHNETTGERLYVSIFEACHIQKGQTLKIFREEQIKTKIAAGSPIQTLMSTFQYNTEHFSDFTIIEELSVGNNKLILSNQSILTGPKNSQPEFFSRIAAIINCHQTEEEALSEPYTVNVQNRYYFPVHTLISRRTESQLVFSRFNEAIWKNLQNGHVFVHCLAGVHRAAAVVVSHFIWRYYKLGHKYLPSDINEIYASLAKKRKGVAGLSYKKFVIEWKDYLMQETGETKCI